MVLVYFYVKNECDKLTLETKAYFEKLQCNIEVHMNGKLTLHSLPVKEDINSESIMLDMLYIDDDGRIVHNGKQK